jgi:hypothetical protein
MWGDCEDAASCLNQCFKHSRNGLFIRAIHAIYAGPAAKDSDVGRSGRRKVGRSGDRRGTPRTTRWDDMEDDGGTSWNPSENNANQ